MPIDFAKVRLQLQNRAIGGASAVAGVHYSGMADCIGRTVRAEGPGALFRGIGPALARQCGYTGLSFLLYEPIRNGMSAGLLHFVPPRCGCCLRSASFRRHLRPCACPVTTRNCRARGRLRKTSLGRGHCGWHGRLRAQPCGGRQDAAAGEQSEVSGGDRHTHPADSRGLGLLGRCLLCLSSECGGSALACMPLTPRRWRGGQASICEPHPQLGVRVMTPVTPIGVRVMTLSFE